MAWSIVYAGAEKLLSDWGLNDLQRNLVSQAIDTVTFDTDGAAVDSDPQFAYGSTVTIKKDGAQWFVGYVVKIPARGNARSERLSYELAGPWYYLAQFVYQQTWVSYLNNQKIPSQYTSHLLLNSNPANGQFVTTGNQIKDALNYVIAQFAAGKAPFQIGAITPAAFIPIDEIRDLTCAEVIRKQLRWHPDAVTWFDYSTIPPAFNCQRLSELAAVNLQIPTAATLLANTPPNISEISVTPRYDLQRPAVAIKYEIKTSLNGTDFLSVITDIAPAGKTGQELNALTATVDLLGATITSVKGSLRVDPINTADINWWIRKFPHLADVRIKNLAFSPNKTIGRVIRLANDTTVASAGLPNEVVEGAVAPWMKNDAGNPASAQQEEISADFDFDVYETDGVLQRASKQNVTFTHKCVSTDMASGDFSSIASIQQGDAQPVGLALALYNALKILTYSGSLNLTEQECSGLALVGNTINLLGGRAEWTTMLAMIQSASEEVDSGVTRVTFGPCEHLTPGDLASLLRVGRYRQRWTNANAQQDGSLSATNDVQLGKQTANANGFPGENLKTFLSINSGATKLTHDAKNAQLNMTQTVAGKTNQVVMSLALCNGKTLYIREAVVCTANADGTTTQQKALFLMTDPY